MPRNESLEIHVHRNGSGHKPGTFTGPAPKMRVDVGDTMTWTLKVEPPVHPPDPDPTFVVAFLGPFWPFAGNPAPMNGTTAVAASAPNPTAVNPGSYLYAVQVTTVDGVYTINHCPEADVGP